MRYSCIRIARQAPLAVTSSIVAINAYFEKDKDGFQQEIEEFNKCTKTKDFKEGVTAFLEKRQPNFRGV